MTTLSFLDLVPVLEGGSISTALANAADMARHCEAMGLDRYWVAEHHGMAGIGGAATSVVLAHIGAATSRIRLGAGGIMLPNHAPLQIAEQFGTLDALYPGRIDLGLGRAPGSDGRVAQALRRTLASSPENFVQDILELQAYFAGDPRLGFKAVPGAGADPEIWILGSSLFGAQVAAALGLPYGFASHFAPALLDQALAVYRAQFQPSARRPRPHAMVACSVFAAATRQEAQYHASSMQQGYVALRRGGGGQGFRPPIEGYAESLSADERRMIEESMAVGVVGTADDVGVFLADLRKRTGADEIIMTSQIYAHEARRESVRLAATAAGCIAPA